MKKYLTIALSILCLLTTNSTIASAQQRTKIADGYYLVSYGNVQVIEDDNRGMSIEVRVEKVGTNSYGEQLYNDLCKNTTIKSVAKGGLTKAISTALNAAGVPIPSWVLGPAVSYIYDAVCAYYGE